jgi:hypothetical protein
MIRHRPGCRFAAAEPGPDLARVESLARSQLRLEASVPVLVRELQPEEKTFPPVETRISFWTGNDGEHRWRLFKPAADVAAADLPPWWMKDALRVDDIPICGCCL